MSGGDSGRLFITRRIPEAGLDLLREAEVTFWIGQEEEDQGLSREELLVGLQECDVVLSQLTEPLDGEVLRQAKHLRGIAQMAVGYNNIDLDTASELGIPVSNTPGVLTDTSADAAFAMLLALARRLPEAQEYLLEGRFKLWGPNLMLGSDVGPGGDGRRKVLGVVGYGRIGQAMARRAAGFEMEVLHTTSSSSREDLLDLLRRSDFVSLHVPLTPSTESLIGEAELRLMKPTAYLINTARGPVVDEAALVRVLEEGGLAGAALDVFEKEPLLAPGLAELARRGKVLALPHIASASRDTRDLMARMAAKDALAHLRGERAENVVRPEVYETEAWRRRGAGLRPR